MGANEASWRDWLWQVGKFGSFKLRINLYRKSQDTIRYDNTLFRVLVFVSFCVALIDSFHLKTIFPAPDCITHEKTFLALICVPVSTWKKSIAIIICFSILCCVCCFSYSKKKAHENPFAMEIVYECLAWVL